MQRSEIVKWIYEINNTKSVPQSLKRFPSHPPPPFDSLRYVLSPRPACWNAAAFKQNYRSSSNVLVSVFFAQHSVTCTSLRPAVSFLSVGVASFRSCPPYCVRRPVAPWPYSIVPPYRPSRFWSSVWLRVAPARLIESVVLWPRGLTTLSLRTDRLVFCSSVWLRFAPARLIASVVLWPRGLTTLSLRTGRLVFDRRCGFVSLLPALSRPSSCGPLALLICPSVPPVFPLSSSRVLP